MKKILKHRWGFVAGIMLAIVFGSVLGAPQTAYADYGDDVSKCKYTMSIDKQEIKRTDCGDKASLVFTNADGPADGVGKFVQTSNEKSCKQTIETDGSGSATLDGEYEGEVTTTQPGTYEQVTSIYCLGFDKVTISVATGTNGSTTTNANAVAARITLVNNRLEALVDEVCKNDSSGRCAVNYQNAIGVCTTKAYGIANSATGNRNNKFRDALLNCLSKETDKGLNARENRVRQALSGQIMNDIEKAAEKAAQQANLGTANEGDPEEDTCNMSGNPVSWILCPIYDGLGGLSDWLLKEFVEPFLFTDPVSTDPNDKTYQIWSAFRIWGNVFLIIALLVIVFGQAIGGGVVDAYTAKKVLPRVLVAAIMINLSIYMVALAVDVTNVLGRGAANIITAPLDGVSMSPDGAWLGFWGFAAAALGAGAGALAITGLLATGIGGIVAVASAFMPFLLLFVLLPAFLAITFVFCILIFRQAAILALILVSPVAFALYCLPNTEQYFKKWWSFLFNMLLLYPIIMIIFAVANVLAYTTLETGGTGSGWAYLTAFLLQFVPLFMIPYAFRLAGGALGRLYDSVNGMGKRGTEAIKGNPNDPTSLRNRVRGKLTDRVAQQRIGYESSTRGSKSRVARRAGKIIGGGAFVQERAAMANENDGKRMANMWSSGDDSYPKAATLYHSMDSLRGTNRWRQGENGEEEFQTADGTWASKSVITAGHKSYGSHAMMQENFKQLLAKTEPLGSEAQENVLNDYINFANGEKLDSGTATGRWQGVAIPLKGMRADLRRAKIGGETGHITRTGFDHKGLLTEYAGMSMHDQVKETPGSFESIRDSIMLAATDQTVPSTPAAQAEQVALRDAARRAYKNLERYSAGRSAPERAQQENLSEDGAPGSYSSSDSAAYKNAEAARIALAELQAAGIGTWADSTFPDDLNRNSGG